MEERLATARTDADRQRFRDAAGRVVVADFMPAHGQRMLVDPRGYLWVEGYKAPGDSTQVWHVFDDEGGYLGDVEVPALLRVVDVGQRDIIGIWRDEYDVESVRRYPIVGIVD